MNKSMVLGMTLVLVSVGLMMFALAPNLPVNAQDTDSCSDSGWTRVKLER